MSYFMIVVGMCMGIVCPLNSYGVSKNPNEFLTKEECIQASNSGAYNNVFPVTIAFLCMTEEEYNDFLDSSAPPPSPEPEEFPL